jgi:hypothetical protein
MRVRVQIAVQVAMVPQLTASPSASNLKSAHGVLEPHALRELQPEDSPPAARDAFPAAPPENHLEACIFGCSFW